MVNANTFGFIIYKFSYWQELSPIILLKNDKSSNIGLYNVVLSLYLAISLRIKGGGKFSLNVEEIRKQIIKISR